MLLIYTHQGSSRLEYAVRLFFGELIRTTFEITHDATRFATFDGAKLNYSKQRFADECFVYAEDLLFERGVREQNVHAGDRKGINTLFANEGRGDLPFDAFAAAFYLVSCYEEYLPFTPDQYGRYPDQQNIAVRKGFHEVPVVNHYALWLQEILKQRYPALLIQPNPFQFQLTYDIDFAFAYKGKGWLKNAGGFARSLLQFNWAEVLSRMNVLLGNERDLFDTYGFQFSLHEKFHLAPVYFFLLGDHARFDRNISWRNAGLQSLIKKISHHYETGIHSSYLSNAHQDKVKTELQRLEAVSGKKIFRNRQHFLKLKFPDTYRMLIANGITEDYTMGFASLTGFRAGIASPFRWYDLCKEEVTNLRLFPFAVMDATLHYYLHLSAQDALEKTKSLMDAVKKVNGYFQFLAHNDLLSEHATWHGWRTGFAELLNYAAGLSKIR